jgi:2-oxoisovalerate dehydrogenase E1 component beta subunit
MRPVAEIHFIDIITCCFQMVTNFAAKSHWRWGAAVPIVVRGPSGGGVGAGPFHSQNVEAYFYHTPGLKIVMPSTVEDAYGLLKAAIRDENPVLYLEHKLLYRRVKGSLPEGDGVVPIGKAAIRRPGTDMSIITYGAMVHQAIDVAESLHEELGAEIEVVDLRTLKPIDWETIHASVKRTSKALVLHEDQLTGGIGGDISAHIGQELFEWLDGPIVRLGSTDVPVPYAKNLERAFQPNPDRLTQACRDLLDY